MTQLVWFKRDLRLHDHAPLCAAAEAARQTGEALICLYIVEPEYWRLSDTSARQYRFLADCLHDLARSLAARGQVLLIRVGNAAAVLAEVATAAAVRAIWSHQETGNGWTYARDRAVAAWARGAGVAWRELPSNGVIRGRHDRDHWAAHWDQVMSRPVLKVPDLPRHSPLVPSELPAPEALGLRDVPAWIEGGRRAAIATLQGFLDTRAEDYVRGMSSPLRAERSCSLLSAALSLGCLSMRETWQAMERRRLQADPGSAWRRAMASFNARLHWHCHFIQKLEDAPSIEFRDLHPAYHGLRPSNPELLAAWQQGRTGYPMIDACMRMLHATGWLNFRMRAMLVSFASHHLWLPWQDTAPVLAGLFTDYEPGIHYSQMQMQSGCTGMNTLRIYNPIKQSHDQDPQGVFLRRWLPEIAHLPDPVLHTPWLAETPPPDYPPPIVEEATARTSAASRLHALRRQPEHSAAAQQIVRQHGSRRRLERRSRRAQHAAAQSDLFTSGPDPARADDCKPISRRRSQ